MKSRIWQLAGVGLLGLSVSLGALAQGPNEEHGGHAGNGPHDPNGGATGTSPLNSRDEVWQTQPPRQGYYQDIPRRPGGDWQGVRTGMAMGGGLARSITPGRPSIVSPTVTGRYLTAARITSTPAATGIARMPAATGW